MLNVLGQVPGEWAGPVPAQRWSGWKIPRGEAQLTLREFGLCLCPPIMAYLSLTLVTPTQLAGGLGGVTYSVLSRQSNIIKRFIVRVSRSFKAPEFLLPSPSLLRTYHTVPGPVPASSLWPRILGTGLMGWGVECVKLVELMGSGNHFPLCEGERTVLLIWLIRKEIGHFTSPTSCA